MKHPTKRLIIWRSLVQAQAGPQTKRLISNEIEPFLFAYPPDINLLLLVDLRLSGNFWLVSFKISYLCLPLFHETRTTPSCHPSGCAYRQL